jgi:DtxR family transcriptional regulator, Mn-dependent transcriptional regulator
MESRNAADNLSESLEDYLEAIYILAQDLKVVRVKDLMKFLNFKVSSINSAIKILGDRGFVAHEKYGHVELTPAGRAVAAKVYSRHENFYRFFHQVLGVEKETARHDACRIEHTLSPETYARFTGFLKYIEQRHSAQEIAKGIARFKDA